MNPRKRLALKLKARAKTAANQTKSTSDISTEQKIVAKAEKIITETLDTPPTVEIKTQAVAAEIKNTPPAEKTTVTPPKSAKIAKKPTLNSTTTLKAKTAKKTTTKKTTPPRKTTKTKTTKKTS